MNRLYVVVRSDLVPGAQLAQSCHAVSAFASLHPRLHAGWQEHEQNLVVLAIADEAALGELVREATMLEIPRAEFYEPDFGNALTACAFSGEAARLLSSLPLALRTPKAA